MSLRFGHIRPQNDKEEVIYFQNIATEYANESNSDLVKQPLLFEYGVHEDERDQIPDGYRAYIICLSADGDCKSQWKEYADDYQGISIGFKTEYFQNCGFERLSNDLGNSVGLFEHVVYENPDEIKGGILSELILDSVMWFPRVFVLQHLHKSPKWHEEQEWRLYFQPSSQLCNPINDQEKTINSNVFAKENQTTSYSGKQTLPFLKLDAEKSPIHSIVLGPNCVLSEHDVQKTLKDNSISHSSIAIKRSDLKIRT